MQVDMDAGKLDRNDMMGVLRSIRKWHVEGLWGHWHKDRIWEKAR